MKLLIRDSTGKQQFAWTTEDNIHDARSRALIDGITTDQGEWLNPAHIVAITEVSDGGK